MNTLPHVLACALFLISSGADAQTGSPTVAPATNTVVLGVGTKVPLKIAEALTTAPVLTPAVAKTAH